jgi:class 3 adenylate cyclase
MAREQRRLAAIVAADVVGYSRLMGRDESGTLARLREHRKQRFEPTLARNGGRLVKLTGDGALAEFPSAVDALSAAIEFQQAMAEVNRDQPEDTTIVFRIGLHLGDLIVDGDDLYGDGVNVAARLEAEAPAGGIVISRTVHESVEGRLTATFEDLGNPVLKNIERAIHAFRVQWNPKDWRTSPASAVAASSVAGLIADPWRRIRRTTVILRERRATTHRGFDSARAELSARELLLVDDVAELVGDLFRTGRCSAHVVGPVLAVDLDDVQPTT